MVRGLLLSLLLLASGLLQPARAERINLYLTDGSHQIVREYKVLEDRVRYYSLERSAWEEIPLDLIDLEKTEQEIERLRKRREARERRERIERQARREARTELHNVPLEDGVYHVDGEKITPVEMAETIMEGSTKRTLLSVITPVPMPKKQVVQLEGARSQFRVGSAQPEFYVRLEKIARLSLARLKKKGGKRIVQTINVMKQTQEMAEVQEEVQLFRRQMAPAVYKIWPVEPLPAGEYAVIEYTPGEGDIRVWDFSYRPSGAGEGSS